jgi:gluconate 5-dehydrogenase
MIFVSSIMGSVARPTVTSYIAAKTGLHGLMRALAVELARHGVTVNALAHGYFPAEGNSSLRRQDPDFEGRIARRTLAGRWGNPRELGAAAVYLASRGGLPDPERAHRRRRTDSCNLTRRCGRAWHNGRGGT